MISFLKSIPYHTKAACKSVIRHLAMTISSASAVTVTLILIMLFLLLAGNINGFTKNMEKSVQIHVTINKVKTDKETKAIGEQIKGIQNVKKVTFSSKENELKEYMEYYGEMFETFKGENNPLKNAYIVEVTKGDYISKVAKEIRKIDGVDTAEFGGANAQNMIKAFDAIRYGGAVFIAALTLLAVFLISNTIKITIYARNREISIMRNVGATNWFIKMPFMIEGMIIGFMGSIIPVLLTIFGYGYIYNKTGGYLITKMFALKTPSPFAYQVSGILILSGMIVGLIGSFFAVNKYLRWKR